MWLAFLLALSSGCSIERGSVKYLRDAGSSHIVWTPKVAAISTLQKIPPLLVTYSVRTPPEMKVYKVSGVLKLVRQESDGDLHVVIADVAGKTMIVEIPSPACVTNSHLPNLQADRSLVLGLASGSKIQVTGVLFLDFAHGQTGHAPNYVELHPVIAVKKL